MLSNFWELIFNEHGLKLGIQYPNQPFTSKIKNYLKSIFHQITPLHHKEIFHKSSKVFEKNLKVPNIQKIFKYLNHLHA